MTMSKDQCFHTTQLVCQQLVSCLKYLNSEYDTKISIVFGIPFNITSQCGVSDGIIGAGECWFPANTEWGADEIELVLDRMILNIANIKANLSK